ncbi:MAG: fused response regulator/phosphatase [Nitrospinae bacterium]|nr:fused response regulator/phosphatase [Nitrospinota bacterium]
MANILVVDDIEDNVFLLRLILEKLGHSVIPAYNGLEALGVAMKGGVDLVLLDVMMPVMNGLEAAARLKGSEVTRHIPIILLTAKKNDVKDIVEGLAAGANEYITKPFHETELVARVNSMLQMKALYDEVSSARTLMMEELRMAQAVQQSLLPSKFPCSDRVKYAAKYEATSSLGGDFYDFIDYGSGRVGLVLADVSGHGPSAALIVSMIKAILGAVEDKDGSPKAVLEKLNETLLKMIPEERFVTIFYGILDSRSGRLVYSRGGHPHPMVLRKKDKAVVPLDAPGDIVGMFETIYMDEVEITLEKGDRLLAYSDGLVEAMNAGGDQYGVANLVNHIKSSWSMDGDALVNGIFDGVREFLAGEPITDDAALFVVEMM